MRIIIAILLGINFTACDCVLYISGRVIDASNNKPLEGVHINNSNTGKSYATTDSTGLFSFTAISGGLFKCNSILVNYNMNGYQNHEAKCPSMQCDTILLRPK